LITNDGKNVIARFLLGQAPEFATHIAAGCGPKPTSSASVSLISASTFATKKTMDFEMFRVPITSKGLIREEVDGQAVEKIVFKAEMPTEQRYAITEIAFFSGEKNLLAGDYDSRVLSTFTTSENWLYVKDNTQNSIEFIDQELGDNFGNMLETLSACPVFFVDLNQSIFDFIQRKQKYEVPRFYFDGLFVKGNSASIDSSFNIRSQDVVVQNNNLFFDLSRNLPEDEIKLSFSIFTKSAGTTDSPDSIRIVFDFVNDLLGAQPKARTTIELSNQDFVGNKYKVVTKKISEFVLDEDFSWANINLTRIYVSLIKDNALANDYFLVLDGLRLDNLTSENPIYAMVGYDVVQTFDGLPIVKEENSKNYIEYRFGVGVT
jgi:hypothetical protein